ncbi:DUF255 domain-containing protein [Stieleria varia]|uniref:Thiol:disulfide interchange protein n=1 Tax=Stieleria varia TaxID=2528005 RepID=A0A5C6AY24_9BACT|nr:DUF255 domain-containing protein [Stieleria varia]TWU04528.1 thiol:disulfide interchange protein precursor [Stieleria varia]
MRIAVLAVVAIAAVGMNASKACAEIAWEGNLRAAHAKAQQEGKLMLLHFYRDNCVWCDRLEAGSFQNPQVSAAINQQFVPVKIHGTKNPKLAEMFKITRYPTDVIVTTDGKALSHNTSPQEPEKYIAMLSGGLQASKAAGTMIAAQAPAAQAPAVQAPAAQPSAGQSVATSQQPAVSQPPSYAQAAAIAAAPPSAPQPSAPAVAASNMPTQVPASTGTQPQSNQFVLPHAVPGATTGQLTGARMDAPRADSMSLTLPVQPTAQAASSAQQQVVSQTPPLPKNESTPELALQGFCAVSLLNNDGWVEGKTEFGVIHLGKLYLFASKEAMDLFVQDPIPYTPMLNEIDVVRFFEERRIVAGKREWGVKDPIHGRMFFFADKAARDHFEMSFERYLDASIKVMEQAIQDANPGT